MDIDYGFWFYYSFEEIQQTGIEKFFNNLQAKLESNIDQVKGQLNFISQTIASQKPGLKHNMKQISLKRK